MYQPLNLTIDRFLQRMEAQGEFDDLPGAGEPIEGLAEFGPTVLDKLMAGADVKPVPVLLNQKIAAIRGQLANERDPITRHSIMRDLADTQTRLAIEIEAYNRYG